MARTKGALNKSTIAKLGALGLPTNAQGAALLKAQAPGNVLPTMIDRRTDQEIIRDITERFDFYHSIVKGMVGGDGFPAVIISGTPGIGKSYTAEIELERGQEVNGTRWIHVKGGAISPINLYKLAYRYQNPGDVIVFDDVDALFKDENSLNILKAMADTSVARKITWFTNSPDLKKEEIDNEFIYRGILLALTNKNFQTHVDSGSAGAEHMGALMSRSIYLDLALHSVRATALWVKHLVNRNKILVQIGLTESQQGEVLEWVLSNQDKLREISIRSALKAGRFAKQYPSNWRRKAEMVMFRTVSPLVLAPTEDGTIPR